MIVVQINAAYKYSSTGRSTYEVHKALQNRGIESYVFWGSVNASTERDDHVISVGNVLDHKLHALITRIFGEYGRGSVLQTRKLCRKLKKIRPDVVHLRNLHSNYVNVRMLFSFLKKQKIPVAFSLHDCWIFTGGCMYYTAHKCQQWQENCQNCPAGIGRLSSPKTQLQRKKKMVQGLEKFTLLGVSRWVAEEAGKSFMKDYAKLGYIYNWMDLKTFCPGDAQALRQEKGWENKKIALCIANSWKTAEKGAADIAALADRLQDVQFVVVGKDTERFSFPENVHCIPHTNSVEELIQYYRAADVFVNPSRQETFGKVTAEALCCGTPVAGYANTATTELVQENCGKLCADGDVEQMAGTIQEILNRGKAQYSAACRAFAEKNFSLDAAVDKHIRFYEELIG